MAAEMAALREQMQALKVRLRIDETLRHAACATIRRGSFAHLLVFLGRRPRTVVRDAALRHG